MLQLQLLLLLLLQRQVQEEVQELARSRVATQAPLECQMRQRPR